MDIVNLPSNFVEFLTDPFGFKKEAARRNTEYWEMMTSEATPLSVLAEEEHNLLLDLINDLIPGDPIRRRVISNPNLNSLGALVKLDDGLEHIIIHPDVADLDPSSRPYQTFASNNPGRSVTPEDFFRSIVAHEYGHIVFGERIRPRIYSPIDRYFGYNLISYNEIDEGFAYWFDHTVTGLRHNLEGKSLNYLMMGVNFQRAIDVYDALNRLTAKEGISAVFDPKRLKGLMAEYGNLYTVLPTKRVNV